MFTTRTSGSLRSGCGFSLVRPLSSSRPSTGSFGLKQPASRILDPVPSSSSKPPTSRVAEHPAAFGLKGSASYAVNRPVLSEPGPSQPRTRSRTRSSAIARYNSKPQSPPQEDPEVTPSATLFALNVPPYVTVEKIKQTFGKIAEVWNVNTPVSHDGKRQRFAHIDFSSVEEARKVLDKHRQSPLNLGEGDLVIQFSNSPTRRISSASNKNEQITFRRQYPPSPFLFVRGLSPGTSRMAIRQIFEPYGDIRDIRMSYYKDGGPMPACCIELASTADATAVVEACRKSRSELRQFTIEFSPDPAASEPPPHHTLRVVGFQGGEDTLRLYFEKYERHIKRLHVLEAMSGLAGWGVGFVEFDTVEQATLARNELSSQEVDYGVRLLITYAWPPKTPTKLAGHYGNDQGGTEFAYGLKGGASNQNRRDSPSKRRFSYETVDWEA